MVQALHNVIKEGEATNRVRFISHHGFRILLIDMTNCKPDEIVEITREAKKITRSQPENSLLLATIITGAHFTREITTMLKAYTQGNSPYVKASAVVGVAGLQEIIINGIKETSGRNNIANFDDLEKAKDWLIRY